jgi:diguanylate cyclase (GGDEF)-like protein
MPFVSSYFWFGQLAAAAAVATATFLAHAIAPIYDPSPFYLCAVVYAAWLGGVAAGFFSAGLTVASAAVLLSAPGAVHGSGAPLWRVLIFAAAAAFAAGLVGALSARVQAFEQREKKHKEANRAAAGEMASLQAALDQVDYGIVVVDPEQRAHFINRAFRKLWRLPDETSEAKPALIALLHHGHHGAAHAIAASEVEAYVAERAALVRSGGGKPLDLHLDDNETLRVGCTLLPRGARMLTCTSLADLMGRAEELTALAGTDSLTGLVNRRRFRSLATAEWYRFLRYRRPLSLLLLDIDRLQPINERLGHAAADEVIAKITAAWRERKRHSDILARLSGDEFAMLMPETGLKEAAVVADRLRREVGRFPVRFGDIAVPVTVSLGVAQAEAGMKRVDELMERAAQALAEAKHAGRNRVTIAPAAEPQVA